MARRLVVALVSAVVPRWYQRRQPPASTRRDVIPSGRHDVGLPKGTGCVVTRRGQDLERGRHGPHLSNPRRRGTERRFERRPRLSDGSGAVRPPGPGPQPARAGDIRGALPRTLIRAVLP